MVILDDFKKLKGLCDSIANKKIVVGIVGNVDSDVLKIAAAHEYGTDKLLERSFIRASFDSNQNKLNEIITTQINNVLDRKTVPEQALESVGAQSSQLIQNFIDENRVKPQSDFSRKTQRTTLYETGTHIRDRISFIVED